MKNYFYRVPYGDTGRSHWLYGRFENKIALNAAAGGKAIEIITAKQLLEQRGEDEVRSIARNCMVYQASVFDEFPEDIAKLLE